MKQVCGFCVLASFFLAGCIHPPPPSQRELKFSDVPDKVSKAFKDHFPDAEVKRVSEWYFDGKVVCYYIDYTQSGSTGKTVAITPAGDLTEYDNNTPPR